MIEAHTIQEIRFDRDSMILKIDEQFFQINLEKVSPKLRSADEIQRQFYKISPSGYGIHWPLIDEDLSVDALLKISTELKP